MAESLYTKLRINRAEPGLADSGDWLRIEQPEWVEPSTSDFINWLKSEGKGQSAETLFLYWAQFRSMCEQDGALTVELQVYKSRQDLVYGASVSYGELSERYVHTASHKKSVTVERSASLDLQVQIVGPVIAVWESAVYGLDGSSINPPPVVSVQGSVLSWGGREVSGVLRLGFTEEHDAYTVTIMPREPGEYEVDDLDSAYQSTFFAVWGGGVEGHDIDLPDMDGYCGGGSSVVVDPDDPDDEECVRHNILFDPCTMEVIREWDEPIVCPENEVG